MSWVSARVSTSTNRSCCTSGLGWYVDASSTVLSGELARSAAHHTAAHDRPRAFEMPGTRISSSGMAVGVAAVPSRLQDAVPTPACFRN